MKKYLFFIVMLSVLNFFAFANDSNMAVSLGGEFNMNSREETATAFGGVFGFDYNLPASFAVGITATVSNDFERTTVIEPAALLRWYFLDRRGRYTGLFVQADGGLSRVTTDDEVENFPLGGLRGGMRIPLGKMFFVEPYARAGYPFTMGAGVMAGIRIPRKEVPPVDFGAMVREMGEQNIVVVQDPGAHRVHLQVYVVFRADHADFEGLPQDILDNNHTVLNHVAELLHASRGYRILVEGHANPTSPPGSQRELEEPELRSLSELRALRVVEELSHLGIEVHRKTVYGAGSSMPLVAWDDRVNNWRNRRVEFILIRN